MSLKTQHEYKLVVNSYKRYRCTRYTYICGIPYIIGILHTLVHTAMY